MIYGVWSDPSYYRQGGDVHILGPFRTSVPRNGWAKASFTTLPIGCGRLARRGAGIVEMLKTELFAKNFPSVPSIGRATVGPLAWILGWNLHLAVSPSIIIQYQHQPALIHRFWPIRQLGTWCIVFGDLEGVGAYGDRVSRTDLNWQGHRQSAQATLTNLKAEMR